MAENRDRQSMGVSRDLASTTMTYRPTAGSALTPGGASWFGALAPMNPIAPPDVKGRILDYPSGYNLNVRPRAYSAITFDMLRAFADSYDLLRLLIETRKDQMARLRFDVVPRAKEMRKKSAALTPEMETRIQSILDFFLRPDKENFWDDWLRMLLEDLFVIDAPTLFRRRTMGGDLYALQPIDGGTIKRVIDDWGNTPLPPNPAYQQVLKGYPAVDYTTEELIYRPRNKRTNKVYGYSPVEQIVMTINIGMRRQTWQLQSFTEGNIPEALIGTPATWTPDQVRQFQDWFDSMMQGNTAERSRARFVPGDVAKGYIPTKPTELFGEAEEWLTRVMCFCFGISPQPFVKMMNRATAESAQEAAAAEGLAPIQNWTKNLMDTILIEDFASPDLEFLWLEEDELDPNIKSQIIDREHAAGRLTYNQARKEQGLDPDPSPDADRAMVRLTDGSWAPMFLTPEEKQAKEDMAAQISGALDATAPPGGEDKTDPPKDTASTGTPPVPGEVAKKSDSPFPAHQHGPSCGRVHGAAPLAKAGKAARSSQNKLYADPLRPFAAKIEKRIARVMSAALAKLGAKIAMQVKAKLNAVAKTDYPDDLDIEKLLADLHIDVFTATQEELEEALEQIGKDSGRLALASMGKVAPDDDLVEKVNERALEWARDRAAELVSEDGLEATTRDMIRSTIADGIEANLSASEIGDALEEAYAFSEDRAQLIAATEITSANSQGSLAGYQEAADAGINVQKSWLVLEDGCDICQENEDAGPIDLDDTFPSGDDAPGAHPNCRCVLVPEVTDEDGNVQEDGEDDTLELADQPRNVRGRFTNDPGSSFMSGMVAGIPGVKAKISHVVTELAENVEDVAPEDDTEMAKLDNSNDMSNFFPVDTSLRGAIWARGGNNVDAVAEREASLLQFVSFDQCIATQDFCDRDKVAIYADDPTAKGFAPMAYLMPDGAFAIQDGHHRAVASKISGNGGMSMNVRTIEE